MSRLALLAVVLCAGCVPSRPDLREDVARRVAARLDNPAVQPGSGAQLDDETRALLRGGLTLDEAVLLALRNNAQLQSAMADLDVERAGLVQASLLPNPTVEAEARFPLDGDRVAYEVALEQDVSFLFALAARRAAATSRLDAAALRAVEAAVDLAASTRAAYHEVQADRALIDLHRTAYEVAAAAYELALRLREAGNVTPLELVQQHAAFEDARLALAAAEATLLRSRERLNRILGLWGPEGAGWHVAEPLPMLPADEQAPVEPDALEARAVEASLALAALRKETAAIDAGVTQARVEGWIPRLAIGVAAEREDDGEWGVGPTASVGLPLFNRNQGGVARAEAEGRRNQSRSRAQAVAVRAAAREAALRLRAAQERAAFLAEVLVPLRERVLEESLRELNAMALGVFELLEKRRAVTEAGVRRVEALREYWLARAEVERLLAGGTPASDASGPPRGPTAAPDDRAAVPQ